MTRSARIIPDQNWTVYQLIPPRCSGCFQKLRARISQDFSAKVRMGPTFTQFVTRGLGSCIAEAAHAFSAQEHPQPVFGAA